MEKNQKKEGIKETSTINVDTKITITELLASNYDKDIKYIWSLRLFQDSENILMEYIDVASRESEIIQLKTPFSIFLIISKPYKHSLFLMLLSLFDTEIIQIYDSNIKLTAQASPLIDVLLQHNKTEKQVKYDLVKIDINRYANCIKIYDFLKTNNKNKHFYYLFGDTDLSFIVGMSLMFEDLTFSGIKHPSYRNDRISFCEHEEDFINNISEKAKKEIWSITNYFVAGGIYTLKSNYELKLLANDATSMYETLPLIVFDIETISNNMIDFPLGANSNEILSSFVLCAMYDNTCIVIISYLRYLKNVRADFWDKVDAALTKKYISIVQQKYSTYDVKVLIRSQNTELELLKNFIFWYNKGKLLYGLTGNEQSFHLLSGHNILNYDLKFLYTRLKMHQLNDIISNFIILDNSIGDDVDNIIIRFHPKSLNLDTLQSFKSHQLVMAADLSLKRMSRILLKHMSDSQKMDLDAVLIRIPYILYFAQSVNTDHARKSMKDFAINVTSIKNTNQVNDYSPFDVDISWLDRNTKLSITMKNESLTKVFSYTYDQIIHYNIIDCLCVKEIIKTMDVYRLMTEFTSMYNLGIEKTMHSKVCSRIQSAFNHQALRFGQICPTNTFTVEVCSGRRLFPEKIEIKNCAIIDTSVNISKESFNEAEDDTSNNESQSKSKKRKNTDLSEDDENIRKKKLKIDGVLSRTNLNIYNNKIATLKRYFETNSMIISHITNHTTKKKYAGAVVYSTRGVFPSALQLDVVSKYPNMMSGKKFCIDSCDIINVESLQKILITVPNLEKNINDLIKLQLIKIILAEDESLNYKEYAKNFQFDCENIQNNYIVGKMIIQKEDLAYFPSSQTLLIYTDITDSFLSPLIKEYIITRKAFQKEMKKHIYGSTEYTVNNCKQLSRKIVINSLYGSFALSYVPVACCTTAFSRKTLIASLKMTKVIVIELCVSLYKLGNKYVLKEKELNTIENEKEEEEEEEEEKNKDSDEDRLSDKFNNFCEECLLDSEYINQVNDKNEILQCALRVYEICKNVWKNKDNLPTQVDIQTLYGRVIIDGTDNVNLIIELTKNMNNIETIWKNKVPDILKNCIFDADTDGFQFYNMFNLSNKYLCDKLNYIMEKKVLFMDSIKFEPKQILMSVCLAKKKYFHIISDKLCSSNNIKPPIASNVPIHLSNIKISHSGYERNSIEPLKYLCNYMAIYCYYMEYVDWKKWKSFEELLLMFFSYLHTLKSDELYITIKLNKLTQDSVRKRFIDKYATIYSGSIKAVYVYNRANNTETLLPLNDYIIDSRSRESKYQLQYAYFLRNLALVWCKTYENFLIHSVNSNQRKYVYSEKLSKGNNKTKILDFMHETFIKWMTSKNSYDITPMMEKYVIF